jgi:hypothetical protein
MSTATAADDDTPECPDDPDVIIQILVEIETHPQTVAATA